ncbi:MAG: Hsp20/alpha crystallin family protein [Anaerolineaceae bacterium]|nr:Hsp20/alpha crystallin family protein [Anaerolineaceae bacterium]
MTVYFNPYFRGYRRQNMARALNQMGTEYHHHLSLAMDVKAEADAYEIKAFLPGVKPEDLDIQIVNEVVTISGELKVERQEQEEFLLAELPKGKFHRVISLPTTLDSDQVEASLSEGILTLRVPKAVEARPKSIKITTK